MARYSGFKYTCPGCGKNLRGVIPAHGDGSAYVFPRHKTPSGLRCGYSRLPVERKRGY
ncbi:MAG TPA: hypothetical protein VF290_02550 [Pyrinomonadaceae bacterium]